MFIVRQQGRMGNAMFQFAFGYALARRLRCYWMITDLRNLRWFALSALRPALNTLFYATAFNGMRALRRLGLPPHERIVSDMEWPEEVLAGARNWVIYKGYFQSEKYFEQARAEIRELFTIRSEWRRFFEIKKGYLFRQNPVAAVHIRRTDFIGWNVVGTDVCLPASYYRTCIEHIANMGSFQWVFVSDDIAWAKAEFSDIPGASFESNDEITDFQLLQNAEVMILSNSSFAWWAAYLNRRQAPIFAPKGWLGFRLGMEWPSGIIPSGWQVVEVGE